MYFFIASATTKHEHSTGVVSMKECGVEKHRDVKGVAEAICS